MRYIHGHHRRGGRFPTGKKPHNYNGGLAFNAHMGRWFITCRDGSHALFYRGVMAAQLGRELDPNEHVHHLNGDCTDDRPENLELLSPEAHGRLHLTPEEAKRRRALRG